MTQIEALKKIKEIIDSAPPYGESLSHRYSQIDRIATEALASLEKDEDEQDELWGTVIGKIDAVAFDSNENLQSLISKMKSLYTIKRNL